MLKFAANLSLMFTEVTLPERFERAAGAGFKYVEIQFPYELDASGVAERLNRFGLQMVLFNLPPGNQSAGERGVGSVPGRQAEFRRGVEQAAEYALRVDCRRVNCLAGNIDAHSNPAVQRQVLVENLGYAAERLARSGIELLLEPLNFFDTPDFFLTSLEEAFAICKEVGSPNLKVQFDFYHTQRTHGELANTVTQRLGQIGHIQLADTPGRHQPGTGEINFRFLLNHLDHAGYTGYVGLEYIPLGTTEESLDWLKEYGYSPG